MLGLVAGLFCVLVVAGLSSAIFKIDLKWYIALNKPSFVVSGWWFSIFVSIAYISSILSVSRLVHFKHFFPSMIFFAVLGIFSVLFVLCFFRLHNLILSLVCMTVVFAMAFTLLIRFFMKELKIALEFLPTFIFNAYAFLCVMYIVMNN